uniref:Tumor necrosis factor receptor superfamily member 19L n=1 Tax=Eptatretus burgeri TaxID=7764 RepID=A0A8C4QBG5_EPTBU
MTLQPNTTGSMANIVNVPTSSIKYGTLAIVPIFCAMGLLGALTCHMLKKKGYRCTTSKPYTEGESCAACERSDPQNDTDDDTFQALVRLVVENPENTEALKQLRMEEDIDSSHANSPSSVTSKEFMANDVDCVEHQGNISDTHTVQAPSSPSVCDKCSERCLNSSIPSGNAVEHGHGPHQKQRTVLAVGRFCVTKIPERARKPGVSGDPIGEAFHSKSIRAIWRLSKSLSKDEEVKPSKDFQEACKVSKGWPISVLDEESLQNLAQKLQDSTVENEPSSPSTLTPPVSHSADQLPWVQLAQQLGLSQALIQTTSGPVDFLASLPQVAPTCTVPDILGALHALGLQEAAKTLALVVLDRNKSHVA